MHTVTDTHSLKQLSVNCGLIYGHFMHSRKGAITPSPCFFTSIKRRNLHVPFHLCWFLTCQNLQVCSSDCSRVCFSVCLSVFLSVCVFVGVNAVIQIQVAQLYNLANYYQTCLPVCSFYCLSVSNITGNPMHGDSLLWLQKTEECSIFAAPNDLLDGIGTLCHTCHILIFILNFCNAPCVQYLRFL